jgi:hypothetical protein
VLALGLASTTYSAGILIGNFENSMDGWTLYDPTDPNISLSYSTNGATLDTNSLRIADVTMAITEPVIKYNVIGNGKLDSFRKNLKVFADVTRLVSEWNEVEGAYCDFTLAVQAGSSSGTPWNKLLGTDAKTSWLNFNGNDPMHIIYDYSSALNQIDFNNLEYLNLVFSTYWGAFAPGGIYYLDNVQIFGGGPAYEPHPSNGEVGVRRDIVLSWTPGAYAKKHDVYFGTDLSKVTDANRTNTLDVLVSKNQADTTYDPPGFLKADTTYYWRIDEVNGPPGYTIYKGDVWNFKTLGTGVGVVIGDWEKSMDGWQRGFQGEAIFDYNDRRGVTLNQYSLTAKVGRGYWTFQRPGWVDLTNMSFLVDVTMIASECPTTTWTNLQAMSVNSNLGWREFTPTAINRLTGTSASLSWTPSAGDAYKTYIFDLSGYTDWANATSIELNLALQTDNQSGTDPNIRRPFHLDNARLLDTRLASAPNPPDYATEVWIAPTLSWTAGKSATKHDVYFDTDFDKVTDANRTVTLGVLKSKNQSGTTYKPGTLAFDTIYYWRIDEVSGSSIRKGRVWVFKTGHFFVVDNFEDYTNTSPYRIWDPNGWKKGGGGKVGYPDPNYAEVDIIHEELQSMPFDYNNLKSPNYSDANRTFVTAQDWTTYGPYSLKSLTLWFKGHPVPVGSFTEPVPPDPNYIITASGTDIWNVTPTRGGGFHDEFHYAYKGVTSGTDVTLPGTSSTFTGVEITAKVESVSNTDAWAKAGVMIRDSLDANSTHGMMCASAANWDSFQYRLETGGTTEANDATSIGLPCWVKLVLDTRNLHGNLRAYRSRDGITWTQSGTVQQIPTMTLPRATPLYVGLPVTAHNDEATCTAVLSNVTIKAGGTPGAWKHQDIGIKSNIAAPLYITLQDSANPPKTATVTHPDPNIVLQSAWQAWDIALSDFKNKTPSLDLTNIKKITIGVGSATPNGTGTLYFDDIRLYTPRCMLDRLRSAADLTGTDCTVNYADLQILADNWLLANPNIDLYKDGTIDLRDYATLANEWLKVLLWP